MHRRGQRCASATAFVVVRSASSITAANDTLDIDYREDRASWDSFVTKINDALNPLDLEFSRLHDEINGTEMYAVVRLNRNYILPCSTSD